jgi:glutaredoxin
MDAMKKAALGALLLAAAALAQAQVFRWVDAKGVTHFSDQPPPPDVKEVSIRSLNGNAATGGDVPYEVAQAMRSAPVTLYTTASCAPCDQARALLQARGVPYTEKSVNGPDDEAQMRAAGGADALPFILVGGNKLSGFEPGALNAALSAASYPAKRQLSNSFRFASATPAAPPKGPSPEELARTTALAAEAAAKAKAEEERRSKVPPKPTFQF